MPEGPGDVQQALHAATASNPAAGRLIGERYRVLGRLGCGAMADVYRAHDETLDRDVALKVFRAAKDDAGSTARRELELHALAQLSHPNLITLFDGDLSAEHPPAFLALELVDGPTLAAVLRDGALPEPQARQIGAQIADALAYVHEQGMVHRDVKPANILLGRDGETDPTAVRARLSDFGIVRLVGSAQLTSANLTLGTACYLAPEQTLSAAVGPAADIYSLGLTLLETLTGAPAFTGAMHEVLAARLARDPEIPAHLPHPWPGLLRAMTAAIPDHRPSATDVARTLRPELSSSIIPMVPGPMGIGAAQAGVEIAAAGEAGAAVAAVGRPTPDAAAGFSEPPQANHPGPGAAVRRRRRHLAWLLIPAAVFLGIVAGAAALVLNPSGPPAAPEHGQPVNSVAPPSGHAGTARADRRHTTSSAPLAPVAETMSARSGRTGRPSRSGDTPSTQPAPSTTARSIPRGKTSVDPTHSAPKAPPTVVNPVPSSTPPSSGNVSSSSSPSTTNPAPSSTPPSSTSSSPTSSPSDPAPTG